MSMTYLYAAFTVVWVVLIGYILNLIRLRKALDNEYKVLRGI